MEKIKKMLIIRYNHNYYLFRKYILSENLLNACHRINPNCNFHAKGCTNQLGDSIQLITVKMNSHQ